MTLKAIVDRKLIMLVVSPIISRISTVFAVYLVSKGFPEAVIDQFITALAAFLAVAFDVGLSSIRTASVKNAVLTDVVTQLDAGDLSALRKHLYVLDTSKGGNK